MFQYILYWHVVATPLARNGSDSHTAVSQTSLRLWNKIVHLTIFDSQNGLTII